MSQTTIVQDLEHLRNKFNFSDADMDSVPQNQFTYLREIFQDTSFRASQYKILNKLIYAEKLLKIIGGTIMEDFSDAIVQIKYSSSGFLGHWPQKPWKL